MPIGSRPGHHQPHAQQGCHSADQLVVTCVTPRVRDDGLWRSDESCATLIHFRMTSSAVGVFFWKSSIHTCRNDDGHRGNNASATRRWVAGVTIIYSRGQSYVHRFQTQRADSRANNHMIRAHEDYFGLSLKTSSSRGFGDCRASDKLHCYFVGTVRPRCGFKASLLFVCDCLKPVPALSGLKWCGLKIVLPGQDVASLAR